MPRLLDAVAALRADWPPLRRFILVDNGSRDATAELAAAGGAVVVSEPRPGYGNACLAGLARCRADEEGPPLAVAFFDADLADDPSRLPDIAEPVLRGEADLSLASRHKLAEPGALDAHQRFGNMLACRLIAMATGRRYRDLGPMRVVSWEALGRLAMADRTWGWTVEMQLKAATRGLRVIETDTPYRRRRAGRSKISGSLVGSVRAGSKILTTVGRLWWAERRHHDGPEP